MKEILKKIIAVFILMMILINSSLLLVISTAVDEIDRIVDESKINPLYEISLDKYVNHNIENNIGTLLQFNLKTGIEYIDGEEYKPLSLTKMLLNLPKIEDEYPESIEVIGKSTKATNGSDNAKDFNFTYNKENGKLEIITENKKDKDGKIYEQKVEGARDEYILICYYSSNCFNNEGIERNLEITGLIEENIADIKEVRKSVEISESYGVKDDISGLVSTNVMTSDIYNGYINSNKKNGTQYKTEYIENLEVNISKKEISDEAIINIKNSFIYKDNNIEETRNIVYKSTKVSKRNVLDILGENGYLQILDENGNVLGEVNRDTEVGDNNIYEIKYEDGISKIILKTSKYLKVGTIFLQSLREVEEIVTNEEIDKIQMDCNIDFINNVEVKTEKLDEKVKNDVKKEEDKEETIIEQKKIHNFNSTNIININESKTNVNFTMNKTEWMNNIQNEIEFTVKLMANNIKCKLFENPIIDIKLPNVVEKVILKESSLLYADNGLRIEKVEVIEDNGSKIIRAKLSGKQNDYYNSGSMIEATELLIPATIIINKDIYDVQGLVQLDVTNNNGNEEVVNKQCEVNIKSINIQTVEDKQDEETSNTDLKNSVEGLETKIKATLGEKTLENGQTVYEHEYIRYDIKVKNNSNYRKENIKVIGKVPEGTVFVNCYFGDYSIAEEDFYHIEEDKEVTEYNQTFSLDAGEEIELSYWIKANTLNDEETQKNIESEVYVKIDEQKVSEYKISNVIKNAKLKLKITASESDGVGNVWIYHFAVKNTSKEAITNIVADIDLQDEVSFVSAEHQLNHEYDYSVTETVNGIRINIPKLEANEEKVAWIKMQVSRIDENKINFEVHTQGTVKGENTDTYHSNLNKEKIYTFSIQVTQTSEKEGQELQFDEEVEFKVKIKNISDEKIHLLTQVVEVMSYADQGLIPQIMEYEYERYNADKNGNETIIDSIDISNKHVPDGVDPNTVPNVKVPLGLVKNGEINITLKYKAGEVKERTEVSSCIKAQYDYGGSHVVTSNIIKNVILPKKGEEPEKPEEPKTYSISGFAWEDKNKNGQYDNDENKFSNITVKLIDADTNKTVVDSEGNSIISRTDSNGRYDFKNVKIGRYILVFEYDDTKYTLTSYKLVSVPEDRNSNAMKEQITIDGESKEVAGTEVISVEDSNVENINIGLVEKEEPEEPEKPEEPKTYSISGFAWEDKNKNGQYDDGENKLSNITVKLVDTKTNKVVVHDNGTAMSVITDSNGDYLFENVKVGEYILVFEYDKSIYKLTICEKENVEEHQNSNVMEKHLTIDGNEANYSVTDILNIVSNIRYINIGLVNKEDNGGDGPIVDDDTFTISGFAWEDKNKDGKYDDNENKLSNITVKLFNSETNAIVKDKDGNKIETKTNDNGEYKFEKIKPGKYLVLFEYDSNNYSLTSYKKEMVPENINSDVIKKQVAIDGVEKTVALTDILMVDKADLVYINMGLVKNQKFDLALDKSITKLKVTYSGFNKQYDYNEAKLVKIEIPAKNIEGAKIEVQYQIKITNEGDLNGYVDEIVDYIPEGFLFDSSNNQGWAQSGKGMLKNTTYAGVIIKPGETKVVTLNLTKTLTNSSIGTLKNTAEILKSSSINGDKDIDSSNGNKVETEDDYSVAELIISIKTGTVIYIGMIIILGLTVLIVLKILVNKKLIDINKIAIFVIGLLFVGIILVPEKNSTYTTDRDVTPSQGEINATVDAYINGISRGGHACNYSTWLVKEGDDPGPYDWQLGEHMVEEEYIDYEEKTTTKTQVKHFDANGHHLGTGSVHCSPGDKYENCVREEEETITTTETVAVTKKKMVKYLEYHTANGYKHHGAAHGAREWYCIYGGDMAQAPNSWTFNYNGYTNLSATLTGLGDISGAVTISNNSNPKYLPYNDGQEDNTHFVVGPFNFSTNGQITGVYLSAGHLCDASGNQITSISNGVDFYVKVAKSIHSVNVSVNVHKTAKREFYTQASWTELWTSGSGGQTLGYDDSANIAGQFDIQTYDTASSTATLPITGLEISKTDYDGNGPLSGYTVEVKDPYYHYKKTFRVNGTTLLLRDLPGNVTYTITEIDTPYGYDIGKQNEYRLNQVLSRGGVVTLINRQFVDISFVEKKVFSFNVPMDGVGFKIYAVTKDGSGWLRSDSCSYGNVVGKIDVAGFLTSSESNARIFYTDANGRINLKDFPMGTYTFKEVYLPPKYAPWYNMSKDINYITKNAKVIQNKRVGNILIEDTIKRGHLILTKEDYDTKQKLAGAQFNITNNGLNGVVPGDVRYVNMNVTIPSTGMLRIDNLPIGEYIITETKSPNDYNLNLQIKTQRVVIQEDPKAVKLEHQTIKTSTVNANVSGKGIVTFNYQNRKYGDLKVRKVDKDTGSTNLEDLLMKDIKFVIAYRRPGETGKRYMKQLAKYNSGSVQYEIIPTDSGNATGAQVFTTNSNGEFEMHNLPQYYEYFIEEIQLPDDTAQYYDIRAPYGAKLLNNYNGTTKSVTTLHIIDNKQIRVDLEGYVWEDIAEGKTTTRDDLYKQNTADKRVAGLTVYLKKNGTILAKRETNSEGKYFFEARGYKDKPGIAGKGDYNYTIDINTLAEYVVEFEYNGLKYEKVLTNLGVDNGSKATEIDSNRTNFNDNFYNIQKDKTGTNVGLTYTRPKDGVSELVQNTAYTVESVNGSVNPNSEALMLADTKTAGYQIRWSAGVRRVRNINLGIFERAQPDLAISTDINDIELTINGSYSHTYEYKSRSPYMNSTGIPDKDINPGYDAVLDGFSVGVKRGNGTYKNCSYTREIYDSYLAYTKVNKDSSDRLRVFVKYKIAVRNESGSLVSRVKLKNYADTRLGYSSSYYTNGNNKVPTTWNSVGNGIWESEEIGIDIQPAQTLYVYLVHELNTETIIEMVNLKGNETIQMGETITEISEYSTWDKKGKRYGGIDKDSAPNNISIGNFKTYEDDTDVAPGLKFGRKSSKIISGLIYEDSVKQGSSLKINEERIGNGKYDNGEKKISNVDVQIVDCSNNQTTKLYNIDASGNVVVEDAKFMTGNNGEYRFVGMVPGRYRVQYTYGRYNGSTQTVIGNSINVTTESYKSTIVNADRFRNLIDNGYINYDERDPNALWYWYQKPGNFEYSSAVDDYNIRSKINKNLSIINYNVKTNYDNLLDIPENHYMIANTGIMDLPIEDTMIQTTDINYIQGSREYKLKFGIVERPRQSLQLNKEISHIRITLPNGQILVDGDPRNSDLAMNYVQYPMYGKLKIEIDNEIIEGATIDLEYEITVENKSERDYDHIRYYRYGDKDSEVLGKIVKINLDAIVDYADEKLSLTYSIGNANSEIEYYNPSTDSFNDKWKIVTDFARENGKIAGIDVQKNVYNFLKSIKRENVVVHKSNRKIAPTEIEKIYLETKKLLTSLGNEDVFDNYAELIQSSNPVGRFYGVMKSESSWEFHTPGNFNISKVKENNESDNSDYINGYQAKAIIIPPTGGIAIIIYCSIGISCLVLLAGGIVLIKKKVIR